MGKRREARDRLAERNVRQKRQCEAEGLGEKVPGHFQQGSPAFGGSWGFTPKRETLEIKQILRKEWDGAGEGPRDGDGEEGRERGEVRVRVREENPRGREQGKPRTEGNGSLGRERGQEVGPGMGRRHVVRNSWQGEHSRQVGWRWGCTSQGLRRKHGGNPPGCVPGRWLSSGRPPGFSDLLTPSPFPLLETRETEVYAVCDLSGGWRCDHRGLWGEPLRLGKRSVHPTCVVPSPVLPNPLQLCVPSPDPACVECLIKQANSLLIQLQPPIKAQLRHPVSVKCLLVPHPCPRQIPH